MFPVFRGNLNVSFNQRVHYETLTNHAHLCSMILSTSRVNGGE